TPVRPRQKILPTLMYIRQRFQENMFYPGLHNTVFGYMKKERLPASREGMREIRTHGIIPEVNFIKQQFWEKNISFRYLMLRETKTISSFISPTGITEGLNIP